MSLGLAAYRGLTAILEPIAPLVLSGRAKKGKEDPQRVGERLGHASYARPIGEVVWLHGASVGETLSLLPLVEALAKARPDLNLLVTSGTVTAAQMMRKRLPAGVLHQYVPVDAPVAVRRFLAHWKPCLAVFVESELWPNLLQGAHKAGCKLALLGARVSDDTAKGWARAPRAARVVEESNEMADLYHIDNADEMRKAFKDRNIAASRNNWLYPYDPLHVEI